MLSIFLINLNRSTDRLAFMQAQFQKLGMTVERIPAVNGADVPVWLASEFAGPHELTAGEIGCYASHLVAAQKIVAAGLPCAIVLEDDVVLLDGFVDVCTAALAAAAPDWDYIHLASNFKRSVINVTELPHGHHLIRYVRQPVNTAAYVLSNRGARKWLSPMLRVRPNDIDIRYAWLQDLDVLGVYPSVARQTNAFASDVGHEPNRIETRSWSPGLASEAYGVWWTLRTVGCSTYLKARALNLWNSGRKRLDGKRRVALLTRR